MASKQVIDRERASRTVIARLEEAAGAAGTGVGAALEEHARRGERVPDASLVLVLVGRVLARAVDAMVEADRAHEQELADDAGVRAARDRAHAECYELVVSSRKLVEASFGDLGLKTLGVWDPCPSDTQGTLSYARGFAAALASSADLGEPRSRAMRFDRRALVAELHDVCGRLDAEMGRVAREDGAARATQAKKDAAMAAHDRAFRNATQVGVAMLQLAGLEELADRVRPSVRKERGEPEPAPASE